MHIVTEIKSFLLPFRDHVCVGLMFTLFIQSVSANYLLTMAVIVDPILVNTNVYSVLTHIP